MRRRGIVALVLAAGLAVLAAYGVARFRRYVDSDPGLCAQCHRASPEFALWKEGSHRGVACQRCHHSTPAEGMAMLRAFLGGRSPEGPRPHARIEVGACAACHLSHDAAWPQIEGSRGHRVHVEEKKIACGECHTAGMRGFEPPVSSCHRCHGEHAVRAAGMQRIHCFACHNFLSDEPGLRPARRDCLRCHRTKGLPAARFPADAPMQLDCGECHRPHALTVSEELIACTGCHRAVPRAGLHAVEGHRACTSCHPAHSWRAEPRACLSCHAQATAHAQGRACGECHAFRRAR